MHARELVELAAVLAVNGETFIHGADEISSRGLHRYWAASKCRLDRWAESLKSYSSQIRADNDRQRSVHWRSVRPVIEEVFISEVLTRVWTCIATGHDRLRASSESEPIARSVLLGHMEARNRALNLMVYGRGARVEEAVELNRLRRRAERWTDLLLGYLAHHHDVSDAAFDASRAQDFAADLRDRRQDATSPLARQLILASLRTDFFQSTSPVVSNSDLNTRVAAAILACLPAELFDSHGLVKSLWSVRLMGTTSETQAMLDDVLALDDRPDTLARSSFDQPDSHRGPDTFTPRQ